jgi:hypothetical protein
MDFLLIQSIFGLMICHMLEHMMCQCCDSLLYKGSEDDVGLELEVTGCVWNKIKRTKAAMIAMRRKVSCSMIAVGLRLVG